MTTIYRYGIIIFISCLLPFSALAQDLEKNTSISSTATAAPATMPAIKPVVPVQDAGKPVPAAAGTQLPLAQPGGQAVKPAAANKQADSAPGAAVNQPLQMVEPALPRQRSVPTGPAANMPQASSPSAPLVAGRMVSPRGSVSLNFDDADIYSVILTVFGEILKVNYIIDPRVKGRVTFRSIAPVPQENVLPLMEVILRLNGVAIVEENSLYRIIPITDLAREPAAINLGRNPEKIQVRGKALLQVVPIEYMQSSDIVKLIAPFVSTSAVIVDIPKSNNIIIADTDTNVKRLLQLIKIFDSEQPKKKGPQVFVHHVQNSKAKDITAVLQQIFLGAKQGDKSSTQGKGQVSVSSPTQTPSPAERNAPQAPAPLQTFQPPGQAGGGEGVVSDLVKIYADEILNAIIILGTPEDYQIIKNTITKLDIVPRQVLLEGAIAQIQLTDKMSLGLAWSLKTNLFGLDNVTIGLNPSQLSSDTSTTSGLSLVGIDSGNSVRAVINALASKSKAKLLASPHIMVSDNREARIQVGQQVPIVTSESYGGAVGVATVPIRTIQYKDIGIILKVKPQINDSGLVALEISQEISTYSKDTFYANEVQIILNKTEASTNLVVQDGQTIIIGGLIREDDSKSRQGIPFLSNIPILGYLFGNTDNEALRTEIVILLTPHVVKNQRDARSATDMFVDKMTDEQVAKEMKKGIQVKEEESK